MNNGLKDDKGVLLKSYLTLCLTAYTATPLILYQLHCNHKGKLLILC